MNRNASFGLFVAGAVAVIAIAIATPLDWIGAPPPPQATLVAPGEVKKDVPYVPTQPATVAAMLRMARVSSDDLVYDLGSGDGRIVITAAKELGARGVGIDIDPVRIREANENAAAAGVADRVTFIEGNLFDADLREATAVTLYLLPDVNLRLRPKLLAELRPGTPVVSHDFSMGDWKPDDRKKIDGDILMLWIVPARVDGPWTWTDASGQERRATVKQAFQTFAGTVKGGTRKLVVRKGALDGEMISFDLALSEDEGEVAERYRGRVAVDTIYGTVETPDGRTSPWTARRE